MQTSTLKGELVQVIPVHGPRHTHTTTTLVSQLVASPLFHFPLWTGFSSINATQDPKGT